MSKIRVIVKKDRMKNQSSLRSLPLLPVVKEILLEQKKYKRITRGYMEANMKINMLIIFV